LEVTTFRLEYSTRGHKMAKKFIEIKKKMFSMRTSRILVKPTSYNFWGLNFEESIRCYKRENCAPHHRASLETMTS